GQLDFINVPNTIALSAMTDPMARSTFAVRISIACGTAMMPTTDICSRMTEMFDQWLKFEFEKLKNNQSATKAKKMPFRSANVTVPRNSEVPARDLCSP